MLNVALALLRGTAVATAPTYIYFSINSYPDAALALAGADKRWREIGATVVAHVAKNERDVAITTADTIARLSKRPYDCRQVRQKMTKTQPGAYFWGVERPRQILADRPFFSNFSIKNGMPMFYTYGKHDVTLKSAKYWLSIVHT